MIDSTDKNAIAKIQKEAFEQYHTPIIIVTVHSMAKHGGGGMTMEDFAKEWFNAWQISKKDPQGKTINKGILILISQQDRKARIELGADWGHSWDSYCQSVMQDIMVANFKKGKYSKGVLYATEALKNMAITGPSSPPPAPDITKQWIQEAENLKVPTSFLEGYLLIGLTALGVFLVIMSFFVGEENRKYCLYGGIIMILIALFSVILVIILGLFIKGGRGRGFGGGFSSSGGFGGGGFSGGGGASGSW